MFKITIESSQPVAELNVKFVNGETAAVVSSTQDGADAEIVRKVPSLHQVSPEPSSSVPGTIQPAAEVSYDIEGRGSNVDESFASVKM